LEAIAQKQGSKVEDELTEAIKSYIERMSAYSNDPFFQVGKAGKSGLKDLAKAHDKYFAFDEHFNQMGFIRKP